MSNMVEQDTENVVGAIIFFTYIAAALFFTGFIARDLNRLYSTVHNGDNTTVRSVVEVAKRRDKAQVFVGLAVVSFAVLSYQMLSFLLSSFSAWWDVSSGLLHPTSLSASNLLRNERLQLPSYIWTWSRRSTLFQDFAESIVDSHEHSWWTQQALLYSLGWNIYMAVEGTRYQVPHLWAYYILDQILPISFTQNLFCAAVLLTQNIPQDATLKASAPGDQFVVVFFYLFSLSLAPTHLGRPSFFAILFAIRILLFVPYWMLRPTKSTSPNTSRNRPQTLYWDYRYSALVLLVGGMYLHIRQAQLTTSITAAVTAINDNHAVATLSYDYLIGIVSLVILVSQKTVSG